MKWNPMTEDPLKQGTYLICGNEIDQLLTDEPDIYYLSDFCFDCLLKKMIWIDHVGNYTDVLSMYWCELPKFPQS